jgi:hypothetical protein
MSRGLNLLGFSGAPVHTSFSELLCHKLFCSQKDSLEITFNSDLLKYTQDALGRKQLAFELGILAWPGSQNLVFQLAAQTN